MGGFGGGNSRPPFVVIVSLRETSRSFVHGPVTLTAEGLFVAGLREACQAFHRRLVDRRALVSLEGLVRLGAEEDPSNR